MPRQWTWVPRDPHSGGVKIPPAVQERTRQRILVYAARKYAGKYIRLEIRFRGPCCYRDAFVEPHLSQNEPPKGWPETREEMIARLRSTPTHLCRLRYFGNENEWSLGFFTYSNEKYSPCVFHSGSFYGTPEEGFN